MFVPNWSMSRLEFAGYLTLLFGAQLGASVAQRYDAAACGSPAECFAAVFGDSFFFAPSVDVAALYENSSLTAYQYIFTHTPSWTSKLFPQKKLKSYHSADLQFWFQNPPLAFGFDFTADELQLAKYMSAMLVEFVTGADAAPLPWRAASGTFLRLDVAAAHQWPPSTVHNYNQANSQFWFNLYATLCGSKTCKCDGTC